MEKRKRTEVRKMAEKECYYGGKLSPGGAKDIPAMHPQQGGGDTKKIRGKDLRTGGGK